jgi:thiol-disulfide isomerase/thioredoxin
MTNNNKTFNGLPVRRSILLAGAGLVAPTWGRTQTTSKNAKPASTGKPSFVKRPKPMTAAEESAAAKAVANDIAQQTGEAPHPAAGSMPRFNSSFKLFSGQDFSGSQANGKLLLIFYWASWCPVCKVVFPLLHDFWLRNRAKGVEVLALSTDSEPQPAFSYIQQRGFLCPTSMASAANLGEQMTPRSLPTLMVRSKLGVILSVDEGEIEADEFDGFLVHL